MTMPKYVKDTVNRAERAVVRGAIDVELVKQLIDLIEWQWKAETAIIREQRERIIELERILAPADRCNRRDRSIPQRLEQGSVVDQ